jgi:hypothetical protein
MAYPSQWLDDLGYPSRYTKSAQNPQVLGMDILFEAK